MPQPKSVQVAFRVYATDWGMRGHGSRQIDWLVDGEFLHKDNVLFVIDRPIDHKYKNKLLDKYRVYDATPIFPYASIFADDVRWEVFLRYWHPKHWVSYNDYHSRHKIRNRLLREVGCQTWSYSHSVNLPKEGYQPWRELEYDHLVLWNETDAAQFDCSIPHQKHILGPLFSSQVPRHIVAVFDSTWDNYAPGMREKFFADMYAYLERHPGTVMFYKPKLKPRPMPEVKNFYILPAWIEPGLVIGCADLTIGIIGASPVIEAQAAGHVAIWYDPASQSPNHLPSLDSVPRIDPAQRFRELLLT